MGDCHEAARITAETKNNDLKPGKTGRKIGSSTLQKKPRNENGQKEEEKKSARKSPTQKQSGKGSGSGVRVGRKNIPKAQINDTGKKAQAVNGR